MCRPQTLILDLLFERLGDLGVDGTALFTAELGCECLKRKDLVADELAHPCQLGLELGLGFEVPRHGVSLSR